jgi:uncharacterized protein
VGCALVNNSKRNLRDRQLNNSMTELVMGVAMYQGIQGINATGGSQLSSYDTIAYSLNYGLISLNRILLTYLFANNGIFQTALQLPIQDALAKGIIIESAELDPQDIDDTLEWLENHKAWSELIDYRTWSRLYGGSALIINTPQDPATPLNLRTLYKAPIEFYAVDRWQITSPTMDAGYDLDFEDMISGDYIYINGEKVHKSRCIISCGKKAPSFIRRQLRGWGMSEAERMLRDLNNYLKTQDVLYDILDESKIDVYKLKDYSKKLATANGTELVQKRVQLSNELKNYLNALIIDAEDEFEQKTLTFSGLADVMKENRIGVAASLRMPLTKLYGISAAGFSSGEEDTNNYNEMVEADIRGPFKPDIRKVLNVAFANQFGRVPSFRFTYPQLRALPEKEAEEIKTSVVNRYLGLYDRNILDAAQTLKAIKKENGADIDDATIEALAGMQKPQGVIDGQTP